MYVCAKWVSLFWHEKARYISSSVYGRASQTHIRMHTRMHTRINNTRTTTLAYLNPLIGQWWDLLPTRWRKSGQVRFEDLSIWCFELRAKNVYWAPNLKIFSSGGCRVFERVKRVGTIFAPCVYTSLAHSIGYHVLEMVSFFIFCLACMRDSLNATEKRTCASGADFMEVSRNQETI